jgi:hypothetical protein
MPPWTNIVRSNRTDGRHVLEQHPVGLEHLARHVGRQRRQRLGRVDAAPHPALVRVEVLVVAAQHHDVVGHRDEQLQRRAQHAVEAEPAAIDVVAEQHQLDVGVVGRVPLVGPHPVDEVGLEQRGLQAAVAAVQVAQHHQLHRLRRPLRVDVAVEELAADRQLADVGLAGELAGADRALAVPGDHRLGHQLVVERHLGLQLARVRRVGLLERIEQRVGQRLQRRRRRAHHLERAGGARRHRRLADQRRRGGVAVAARGREVREQLVVQELLGLADQAVGVHHRPHQLERGGLLAGRQRLEQRQRAHLEPGRDVALVARGHHLAAEPGDHRLEAGVDLVEVALVRRPRADPLLDRAAVLGVDHQQHRLEVALDERLLALVELPVDVAHRHQQIDQLGGAPEAVGGGERRWVGALGGQGRSSTPQCRQPAPRGARPPTINARVTSRTPRAPA